MILIGGTVFQALPVCTCYVLIRQPVIFVVEELIDSEHSWRVSVESISVSPNGNTCKPFLSCLTTVSLAIP